MSQIGPVQTVTHTGLLIGIAIHAKDLMDIFVGLQLNTLVAAGKAVAAAALKLEITDVKLVINFGT